MSAKLERIYWLYQQLKANRYPSRSRYCEQYEVAAGSFKRDLEFLRCRLQALIVYDRLHNGYWGYRLTDDSFELPSLAQPAHPALPGRRLQPAPPS